MSLFPGSLTTILTVLAMPYDNLGDNLANINDLGDALDNLDNLSDALDNLDDILDDHDNLGDDLDNLCEALDNLYNLGDTFDDLGNDLDDDPGEVQTQPVHLRSVGAAAYCPVCKGIILRNIKVLSIDYSLLNCQPIRVWARRAQGGGSLKGVI